MQEIGLAGGEQLLHLLGLDRALQDDLARAKIAAAVGTGRFLADISHAVAEYAATAFWTNAQRFLAGKIDGLGVGVAAVLAEVEFGLEFGVELNYRDEWLAHAAAKAL